MKSALVLLLLVACAHAAPSPVETALPGRGVPAMQAGDRSFGTGDLEGAVRWYTRAIADEPGSAEARYLRARALVEQDDVVAAEADLVEALRLLPTHWEARCLLGVVRQRQGRAADAAREFRTAVSLAPREEAPRNDLAFLAILDGRPAEAYDALRDLAREFPRSARVWNNLALAAERTGRRDEAAAARAHATRLKGALR